MEESEHVVSKYQQQKKTKNTTNEAQKIQVEKNYIMQKCVN